MFEIMKKLIGKKFYTTAEEAQNKVDVFYATNRLDDDQYAELTEAVIAAYGAEPA